VVFVGTALVAVRGQGLALSLLPRVNWDRDQKKSTKKGQKPLFPLDEISKSIIIIKKK
jgi:hypothetical protein